VVASSYRLELSQAEAGALFDRLDLDQSGALSRRELGVWGGVKGAWGTYQANAKQRAATKQEAKKAAAKVNIQAGTPSLADLFQLLDTDRNGTLTRAEVLAGASQLGLSVSQAFLTFGCIRGEMLRVARGLSVFARVQTKNNNPSAALTHTLSPPLSPLPNHCTSPLPSPQTLTLQAGKRFD
jgi:hypothetical protein